ncbi:hypothetical protein GMORB2_6776 [Geosmithia morbida]|uniref:Uncharacterized protein n=1 Tax=Geosmithia morbida TaxID=1094350 RepID=A0A9P5D473_9HYPO|nr:uncharacterized protein GMORB2_6776 [Geosmithia morbida]KAF4123226.1 hypothetical protein GMORB2_6776 [Geosmithia morbida]
MSDAQHSPRRRHILSSINPEAAGVEAAPEEDRPRRRRRSRSPSEADDRRQHKQHASTTNEDDGDTTRPRRSRLRLKDASRRRRHRSHSREKQAGQDRHHHHGHRRHRRHRSPTPPNPFDGPPLDAETAFRESLFDAMADDEGADYWAAVYGQPVHVYSNERANPQGELERMTDDEYAAHVRQRMWEKTHAGMLEERARRGEERQRRRDDERRRRRHQRDVDESLRRGDERRRRRRWADSWSAYQAAWAAWDGTPGSLAWPLGRGRPGDDGISPDEVRIFMVRGLRLDEGENMAAPSAAAAAAAPAPAAAVARLKDERVRWHPDKIQQKARGEVDDATMKNVTAVFQVIDRLWGELRPKD